MIKKLSLIVTLMALLTTSVYASEGTYGAGAAQTDGDLTLDDMLRYALEDERLAQAEYQAIMENFDVRNPFANIEKAEQTHEAALIDLYLARDMKLPDFDASSHLVIPDTLEEIYAVGIQAEINNIAMYESFLQEDLDEDVRLVFEALKRGSESHLAAFERASQGNLEGSMARNGQENSRNGQDNSRNVLGNASQANGNKRNISQEIGANRGMNQQNKQNEDCTIVE